MSQIFVWADWEGPGDARPLGTLHATRVRGRETFAFEFDPAWFGTAETEIFDPDLRPFGGRQYPPQNRENFGVFLDSSPDRWGRVLMERREARRARLANERPRSLFPSDFLLGVHDQHRIGALRFRRSPDGPFLDDNDDLASPPWASLRELETRVSS